jgi:DNA invertase Pin-like site-specific DNA recombinase
MERELKNERAAAGRNVVKARGETDRRPKIDPKKLEQARILYENSEQTAAEVCQKVGVEKKSLFQLSCSEAGGISTTG